MMTRGQVARRLGKSLATIRRMEGTRLHPWQDERGVHRFSRNEVERAARSEAPHTRTPPRGHESFLTPQGREASGDGEPLERLDERATRPGTSALEARILTLESEIAACKCASAEVRAALELRNNDLEAANSKLLALLQEELLTIVAELPRRQLLRLLEQEPDLLDDLLP